MTMGYALMAQLPQIKDRKTTVQLVGVAKKVEKHALMIKMADKLIEKVSFKSSKLYK